MDNPEEVMQQLEVFNKRKTKIITPILNSYLEHVARTGDPVFQWSLVKSLFKEKLLNVLHDFMETSPGGEIPSYPNVEPFNYETMKESLLDRIESFTGTPFTVQRICELLIYPRKQYSRIDRFMRAFEKNILVVSTREPGPQRPLEVDHGEPAEANVNGSDNSDYSVDVEMEDVTCKETIKGSQEPQPSSSEAHASTQERKESPHKVSVLTDKSHKSRSHSKGSPHTANEKEVSEHKNPPSPNHEKMASDELDSVVTDKAAPTEIENESKMSPSISIPKIIVYSPDKMADQKALDLDDSDNQTEDQKSDSSTESDESMSHLKKTGDESPPAAEDETAARRSLPLEDASYTQPETKTVLVKHCSEKQETEPVTSIVEKPEVKATETKDEVVVKNGNGTESSEPETEEAHVEEDKYSISDVKSDLVQASTETSKSPTSEEEAAPPTEVDPQ